MWYLLIPSRSLMIMETYIFSINLLTFKVWKWAISTGLKWCWVQHARRWVTVCHVSCKKTKVAVAPPQSLSATLEKNCHLLAEELGIIFHDSELKVEAEVLCQRTTLKIWESCIFCSCLWSGWFGGTSHVQMVILITRISMASQGCCNTVFNVTSLPSYPLVCNNAKERESLLSKSRGTLS